MELNSFVAYILNEEGNSIIAFGFSSSWENTRFLYIIFTDSGPKIHFYNYENDSKTIFLSLQSKIVSGKYESDFQRFEGNAELVELINEFETSEIGLLHLSECSCALCHLYDFRLFLNDPVTRVLEKYAVRK